MIMKLVANPALLFCHQMRYPSFLDSAIWVVKERVCVLQNKVRLHGVAGYVLC